MEEFTLPQAADPERCASGGKDLDSERVRQEVNDDALKKWFVGLQGDILPIDDEVQENVKKVVTSNPQLVDFKQVKSSGDAFLIATAMKYDLTVITEENKTGQKKIPFVCNSLGVPCVDILGLCEKEGWSF